MRAWADRVGRRAERSSTGPSPPSGSRGRRSPRYRDVEPALRTGQDKGDEGRAGGAEQVGYVRGAGFYGED